MGGTDVAVAEAVGVTVGTGVKVANATGSRLASVVINVGDVASVATLAGKAAGLFDVQATSPIKRPRADAAIMTTFIVLIIER